MLYHTPELFIRWIYTSLRSILPQVLVPQLRSQYLEWLTGDQVRWVLEQFGPSVVRILGIRQAYPG